MTDLHIDPNEKDDRVVDLLKRARSVVADRGRRAGRPLHTTTIADGRTVGYYEYGEPAGRPVVAVHGTPGCGAGFSWAADAATRYGVRLLAPDRPGVGLSSPTDRTPTEGISMRLAALSGLTFLAATSFGLMGCGGSGDDDAGVTITGDPHTYVVDSITVPTDQNSANNLGFDLDGDGTVDNQLGSVLSAIVQAAGSANLDIQGGIDKAVNDGSILLLADIQATALDSAANAGLFVFLGTNPSPAPCTDPADPTTCGQHLLGTGTFDIDPNGPQDVQVGGNIIGGTFSNTVAGNLALQISFQGAAVNLTLVDAYAQISGITADGFGQSKIGGAVPNTDIQNNVIPAVAAQVETIIERDCYTNGAPNGAPPDCGCTASSTGATLVGLFDTSPADCTVGVDEFRNNNLIKTLLQPDVDTDGDGTTDALSVGVGVTGVKGTWTPPAGHGA